jgi:hypothetical protein
MKMTIQTVAELALIFTPLLYGKEMTSTANLSCVSSLELPTRGLLAAGAGASGIVHVFARIGRDGRLSNLKLDGGNPGLQGEVGVAINLSRFAVKCQDRTVEFIFAFTLEDPPTDSIIPPGVRFIPPNRFELVFRRLRPNYDPSSPVVPNSREPKRTPREPRDRRTVIPSSF